MTDIVLTSSSLSTELTTTTNVVAATSNASELSSVVNLTSSSSPAIFNSLTGSAVDVNDVVNVTREYPFEYATVMFGYLMPFVLVLTLITNTLVVMVLAQRHMRTPTNIVLFTMAIVDLMTLLSPSPWYFYIYTLGYHDKYLYPPIACYAHSIMTDVIPVFFHTSSIWLALLLASQRYIYVCHPTLARTWCTVPRVKKAIVIILVTAFMHQLSRFFDIWFVPVSIEDHRQRGVFRMACRIQTADWVHRINAALYYTTYYTFRILFVFIIPCVALITLNYLLFRALRRAENKRTELLKTKFKLVRGNHCSLAGAFETARESSYNKINSSHLSKAHLNSDPQRKQRSSFYHRHHHQVKNKNTNNNNNNNDNNGGSSANLNSNSNLRATPAGSQMGSPADTSITLLKTNKDDIMEACEGLQASQQPPESSQGDKQRRPMSSLDDNNAIDFINCDDEDDDANDDTKSCDNDADVDDEGEDDEEDEDISSCPECAAAADCQRCSAATDDGGPTTTTCGERADHSHKPISQCSSLLGGATNTTTNEDLSSYLATQNASSSMFAPLCHGDDGEAASIREGDDCDALNDQDNTSERASNDSPQSKEAMDEEGDEQQIDKISGGDPTTATTTTTRANRGSADSGRLACGCLMTAKAKAMRRMRLLGKSRRACRGYCHSMDCQPMDKQQLALVDGTYSKEGQPQDRRPTQRGSRCKATCSSSEPCIHCSMRRAKPKGDDDDDDEARRAMLTSHSDYGEKDGVIGGDGGTSQVDHSHHHHHHNHHHHHHHHNHHRHHHQHPKQQQQNQPHMRSKNNNDNHLELRRNSNATAAGAASAAAAAAAAAEDDDDQHDMFACGNAIATTTTTTTTTTTLYSANNNSVASLLQVQQATGLKRQGSQVAPRMKSPSFASSTGRGSRATLTGAHPMIVASGAGAGPVAIPAQQQQHQHSSSMASAPSASVRTMDSNRTTLMLIVVVTVFLMVEVPVAIVTILHVVLNTFDVFREEYESLDTSLKYIILFTNFFIMISYSVNFTIYCSMSKKFRETFRDIFFCRARSKRKRAQRLLDQQHQYSQYNPPTQYTTNIHQHHYNNNNNSHHQPTTLGAPPSQLTNVNTLTTTANDHNSINNNNNTNSNQNIGTPNRTTSINTDFVTTAGGLNNSTGLTRLYHCGGGVAVGGAAVASNHNNHQECEL